MARPLLADLSSYRSSKVVVSRTAPKKRAKVKLSGSEQTMSKHSIGSETNTVTGLAECFGHAGNNAKLPTAIDITPTCCGIAFSFSDWFQWEDVADRRNDLAASKSASA